VSVADGTTTKSTVLTGITVTEVDPVNDTVSGTAAPGSEVRVEAYADDGHERVVTADSEGDWQADFSEAAGSEPQQQEYDFVAGSEGNASQEDADGDQTQVDWAVADPRFAIDPVQDAIWGGEWAASAIVTVTVEDPGTGMSPDIRAETNSNAEGEFDFDAEDLEFDLKPGQTMTVTDGTTTKITTITGVTVTEVNPAADTVSGEASPGSEVRVEVDAGGGFQRTETADSEGDWQADFSAAAGPEPEQQAYDIVAGTDGNANQEDVDGDRTEVGWDAPALMAVGDHFGVSEDSTLTQVVPGPLANDTYISGGTTIWVLAQPSHGTLVLDDQTGAFTYRPTSNWHGSDSFAYRLVGGGLSSDPATVTITVASVNDAPVSSEDTAAAAQDTTLTVAAPGVLSNDTDVDGDTLTAVLATASANGTLALHSDGSYTYRPTTGWVGTDRFWYRVSDASGPSAITTVTITVRDGAAPQLTHDARTSYTGTAVIHLSGVDPAPSGGMDYLQWRLMKDGVGSAVQANTVHTSSTSANDVVTVTQPGSYHLYVDAQDRAGNEMDQADIAFTVTALPAAKLTVTTPSKVKRSKNFYVTGNLTPAHPTATTITLRFERYYKRKWRLAKKVTVRLAANTTSYKYKAKLSPKGSWRVVASHGADSAHTGTATATRKFTVK
jgi:hypothetical protein